MVDVQFKIFLNVIPCSLIDKYQGIGETSAQSPEQNSFLL
jgi:hypothetical protein